MHFLGKALTSSAATQRHNRRPGLELCDCQGASSPSAAVSRNVFLSPNVTPQNAVLEITATAAWRQRARGTVAPEHLENPGPLPRRRRHPFLSIPCRSSANLSVPLPAPTARCPGPDRSLGRDTGLCKLTWIITMCFVKQSPFGGGSDYSLLL